MNGPPSKNPKECSRTMHVGINKLIIFMELNFLRAFCDQIYRYAVMPIITIKVSRCWLQFIYILIAKYNTVVVISFLLFCLPWRSQLITIPHRWKYFSCYWCASALMFFKKKNWVSTIGWSLTWLRGHYMKAEQQKCINSEVLCTLYYGFVYRLKMNTSARPATWIRFFFCVGLKRVVHGICNRCVKR